MKTLVSNIITFCWDHNIDVCGESPSSSLQNLSRVRSEYEQEGFPPSVKPVKVCA